MTRGDNSAKEDMQELIDTKFDKLLADLSTQEKKEVLMAIMEKMNEAVNTRETLRNTMTARCCC